MNVPATPQSWFRLIRPVAEAAGGAAVSIISSSFNNGTVEFS